jgi:DNA-binding MarR family transcriptional regulator
MKISSSRYGQCLYFTTSALARKVERLAQESWKKVDLSPSHAYLLMAVLEEPGIQPSILVDHLQLQPSTITRLVDKLEIKKLVVRTSAGKVINIYPTPKAKELQPRLKQCMNEFCQRYSQILGKDESARLVQNMGRMADRLEG